MGFQNVFGHKQKIGFAALSGPPAPVYGPYTLAFAAVVVSRGGVVTTAEKAYLTTFENSVGGDLAEFDRLFIHGLTSSVAARTSFVNPSTTAITAVNSPLFTPGVGYTGNGTTAYLNHNVQESALIKYTQNSNSFFLYCNSNITEIVNEYGVYNPGTARITASIVNHPTFAYLTDNNVTSSVSQTSNLNSVGLFQCKRVGTQIDNYFNGSIFVGSSAAAQPLQNLTIYSLARNNSGTTAEVFSNKQHCLIGYGSASINSTNFNNAVQALSTSLKWSSYTNLFTNTVLYRGGVVTTDEQTYLRTFENSVGTDLAEFDRLWIHGLSDSIAARTSFVNPNSNIATGINGPIFTPGLGYQSDGVTSYIDLKYNLATDGVKFQLNNCSQFTYSRTNSSSTEVDSGGIQGGVKTLMDLREINDFSYSFINVSVADSLSTYLSTDSLGLFFSKRIASNLAYQYQAGILKNTITVPSNAIPNINLFALAVNINGVPTYFAPRQTSIRGYGSGAVNQTNFYNAVQALGTSIGWAV